MNLLLFFLALFFGTQISSCKSQNSENLNQINNLPTSNFQIGSAKIESAGPVRKYKISQENLNNLTGPQVEEEYLLDITARERHMRAEEKEEIERIRNELKGVRGKLKEALGTIKQERKEKQLLEEELGRRERWRNMQRERREEKLQKALMDKSAKVVRQEEKEAEKMMLNDSMFDIAEKYKLKKMVDPLNKQDWQEYQERKRIERYYAQLEKEERMKRLKEDRAAFLKSKRAHRMLQKQQAEAEHEMRMDEARYQRLYGNQD